MYPFHIQKVQLLTKDDYLHHEQFMPRMLDITRLSNPLFPATVLFTDDTSFTREGIVNTHNAHMWTMDNPYAVYHGNLNRGLLSMCGQESSVIISWATLAA
ncbi:hypothetical protein AVEN_98922-1 [Araneus ventricosus]|uniref:Uncharacterized protein n=1 Tax=Araneus ventricosus TaxID=182803 RepID=A0A4Y2PMB6_ARAVE|nr:hypothetical protein AVEN_98922-1 [Araneus ventricosus]